MYDTNTLKVKKRYDRASFIRDSVDYPMEKLYYKRWRKKLLSHLKCDVLEIGIGTGKNLEFYGNKANVTGIDISKGMLSRARINAKGLGREFNLLIADAQNLMFADNSFDFVIGFLVLCSIPDPVRALKEMARVVKPGGKIILVEHVLSKSMFIALIENMFNPFPKYLFGFEINRDTRRNIEKAGLKMIEDKNLALFDVFRLFVAGK